jgi:hypothetical protein
MVGGGGADQLAGGASPLGSLQEYRLHCCLLERFSFLPGRATHFQGFGTMTGTRIEKILIALSVAALAATAMASETISYSYDARGRLVRVVRSGTVNNGVTANYSYDKADNRTNVNVASPNSPPPP